MQALGSLCRKKPWEDNLEVSRGGARHAFRDSMWVPAGDCSPATNAISMSGRHPIPLNAGGYLVDTQPAREHVAFSQSSRWPYHGNAE